MKIQVSAVYEAALRLMSPLTMAGTYTAILEEAQKLAKADHGSIFLFDNGGFTRVFSTSPKKLKVEPRPYGFSSEAFYTKKTICVPVKELSKHHREYQNSGIEFTIIIPLTYEDQTLGVVALDSSKDLTIVKQDVDILNLFGSLASLKIRNNFLYEELKNALETRDLFISMASHELKNPLTTVSTYAQLMNMSVEKKKSFDKKWVSNILRATKRMTRMINELFDINQIKNGKMTFAYKKVKIEQILKSAITEFNSTYPEHTVSLRDKRQFSKNIWGDFDKLHQVFTNLLNNAGKFSPTNKLINIDLTDKKDKITIKITDRGNGITSKDLRHLFSEFYKGSNRKSEGLGLGLFISKKVVEAHSGEIKVKSKLGQGSSFYVTLPYEQQRKKSALSSKRSR